MKKLSISDFKEEMRTHNSAGQEIFLEIMRDAHFEALGRLFYRGNAIDAIFEYEPPVKGLSVEPECPFYSQFASATNESLLQIARFTMRYLQIYKSQEETF